MSGAVFGYVFIALGGTSALASVIWAIVAIIAITHREMEQRDVGIIGVVLSPFFVFMACWLVSAGLTWIH